MPGEARLAVIAAVPLPIGLAVLPAHSAMDGGNRPVRICVGLGSSLTSIVGNTLPL